MKLHHIGIVVDNIEKASSQYKRYLGLQALSEITIDPLQRVRIQLCGNQGEAGLELIQPVGEDSPVQHFLMKGGGIYHLCFEVDNIENAVSDAINEGGICVSEPLPAVVFQNQKVAFLFFPDIGLIEFIEGNSL
jgi:methylmalonyl-CoA/ethylmalonyl-CoA epimerase